MEDENPRNQPWVNIGILEKAWQNIWAREPHTCQPITSHEPFGLLTHGWFVCMPSLLFRACGINVHTHKFILIHYTAYRTYQRLLWKWKQERKVVLYWPWYEDSNPPMCVVITKFPMLKIDISQDIRNGLMESAIAKQYVLKMTKIFILRPAITNS